jgi:tRNA(adenine34) deaminase
MKAYLNNLTMKTWLLLLVPTLAIAYPVARVVVPAVIRAVVPEVVRNVLTVIWAVEHEFLRPRSFHRPTYNNFNFIHSMPNDQRPATDDGLLSDELWMEEALRCAQRALEMDEVPVGAIVVCEGKIIGRGWNRNIASSDPTAHAEIVALREAGTTIGNHRMGDCELFATIEPCPMCAGAMVHARIKRLVYGSDDPKAGAVHSVMQVLNHPQLNHKLLVRGGILAGRSAELLQTFFKNRR